MTLLCIPLNRSNPKRISPQVHYCIYPCKAVMSILSICGSTVCVLSSPGPTPIVMDLIQCPPHSQGHCPDMFLTLSCLICVFLLMDYFHQYKHSLKSSILIKKGKKLPWFHTHLQLKPQMSPSVGSKTLPKGHLYLMPPVLLILVWIDCSALKISLP